MASTVAQHDAPAWKRKADFLIFADLTAFGLPGRWEQLWARRISESEFEICCIPYFTYGLALGDTVSTRPVGGKTYVVADVLMRSGRRVLRLWLKGAVGEARDLLRRYLSSAPLAHEWSSDNLVAIDLPSEELDADGSTLLASLTDLGVDLEWGERS
ncbi:MAG: DUF4265 domain-containing protein [Byssovorax sp.]